MGPFSHGCLRVGLQITAKALKPSARGRGANRCARCSGTRRPGPPWTLVRGVAMKHRAKLVVCGAQRQRESVLLPTLNSSRYSRFGTWIWGLGGDRGRVWHHLLASKSVFDGFAEILVKGSKYSPCQLICPRRSRRINIARPNQPQGNGRDLALAYNATMMRTFEYCRKQTVRHYQIDQDGIPESVYFR